MAKLSIKKAVKGRIPFDLSSTHITTSDFGQLQVSQFLPVVPNDRFNLSVFSEARFAPLVVPTFMKCSMVHRAYYVPMSAIWKQFENFYIAKQDSGALLNLPSAANSDFVSFMSEFCTLEVSANDVWDFRLGSGSDVSYWRFTEDGRIFKKLLESLGYSINYCTQDSTSMSLLPLLAWMRVVYDYVYPSQYLDDLALLRYFNVTTAQEMTALFRGTGITDFLFKIKQLLVMPFKQDYFTAAWKNLNASGSFLQSIDINAPDGKRVLNSSNTIITSSTNGVSQFGLNLLSRLYDFVTRNNLVGTRYADQIFARFGIGSKQSDKDMSRFVGQYIQPISVADVTAMSGTTEQDLGELAGKAFMAGKGQLAQFDADEFGYMIVMSYIMPDIAYYQGRKRWTTNFGRFDFYQPEFDMQMRAIRNDELFADFLGDYEFEAGINYGGNPTGVFGFAPNYSEYKKGHDYLTGDFRVKSLRSNLDSYHLFRDLQVPSSDHPLALNSEFLFCQQHEFDKIFAQQYTQRDGFGLGEVVNVNGRGNLKVITKGSQVLVFRVTRGSSSVYYVPLVQPSEVYGRSGQRLREVTMFFADVTQLNTLFGVVFTDPSSYTFVDAEEGTGEYAGKWVFPLLSQKYYIYGRDGVLPTSTDSLDVYRQYTLLGSLQDGAIETFDDFLQPYLDYIDHAYIRHYFKITAVRSMVPISEEFMIQDGGDHVSVDAQGNRIS